MLQNIFVTKLLWLKLFNAIFIIEFLINVKFKSLFNFIILISPNKSYCVRLNTNLLVAYSNI